MRTVSFPIRRPNSTRRFTEGCRKARLGECTETWAERSEEIEQKPLSVLIDHRLEAINTMRGDTCTSAYRKCSSSHNPRCQHRRQPDTGAVVKSRQVFLTVPVPGGALQQLISPRTLAPALHACPTPSAHKLYTAESCLYGRTAGYTFTACVRACVRVCVCVRARARE